MPGAISRDVVAREIEQRAGLDQAARGVEFDIAQVGAVAGLVAAQPGDPAGGVGERAAERLDLAHIAAGLAHVEP